MTKYVIDASVIIEYLLPGPYTQNAKAFFSQVVPSDTPNIPEFCLIECTNVLWKQVRFKNLTLVDAESLLSDLRNLRLRRAPIKHLLETSLHMALNNQLAVYDSGYISLAKHYACPLIIIDQPQLRAAEAEGVNVIPLTDFHP